MTIYFIPVSLHLKSFLIPQFSKALRRISIKEKCTVWTKLHSCYVLYI